MYESFETVLILSFFGFVSTALLLCIKPITTKKFPANWQYYIWIVVFFLMITPIYKLIPKQDLQKLTFVSQNQAVQQEADTGAEIVEINLDEIMPVRYKEVIITPHLRIKLFDLFACFWLLGVCIYGLFIITSYCIFIFRKRKNAVNLSEYDLLNDVKRELKIKRKIKLRMSPDVESPMLVGLLFPVIYLPCKEMPKERVRMVLLHELTHYKRMDLQVKWLSVLVNALHWFNPMVYLLCVNISEACEVSCDMSVTKNMTDDEQKFYMKTILDLVE